MQVAAQSCQLSAKLIEISINVHSNKQSSK